VNPFVAVLLALVWLFPLWALKQLIDELRGGSVQEEKREHGD
jgi:hypothetical protein